MKEIKKCTKCRLSKNQHPLLQNKIRPSHVMFAGLSAVQTDNIDLDEPFSTETRSGALLREFEQQLPKYNFYFTNLVKCLPLRKDKIRYPSIPELSACFPNFELELKKVVPKKVVIFGKKVSQHVSEMFGFQFEKKAGKLEFSTHWHGTVL